VCNDHGNAAVVWQVTLKYMGALIGRQCRSHCARIGRSCCSHDCGKDHCKVSLMGFTVGHCTRNASECGSSFTSVFFWFFVLFFLWNFVAVICWRRFTARISEFMKVLDELSEGKYIRTMVVSADLSDSEY